MGHDKVKVVDESRVAPPPGSLPTTLTLPLTLFDLAPLISSRKYTFKRLFFYANPMSLHEFIQTTIPSLKSSLSITLQYFYPFVSNLILPPSPQKPYFQFTEGNSVSFTIAQYSGDDFDYLTSNKIKEAKLLQSFSPKLPPTRVSPDGTQVDSLLAIKVTLFPEQGICIGIGFNHTVTDGRSLIHFMKSWASICRSNGVVETDKFIMPSFDRDSIKDPYELESKLLKMWHERDENITHAHVYADNVRSTFVLKRTHIEKLKHIISNNGAVHFSSFVVTCSFVWTCLIKSLKTGDNKGEDKVCRLYFAADLRDRIKRIPTTYFGNCVSNFNVDVKRSELVEHNGIFVAARAVGNCIKEFKSNIELQKVATPFDRQGFGSPIPVAIAGSPKFDVYKTDFGWGLPRKTEVLHLDCGIAMSMIECRDEEGGIEISLELERADMDAFTQIFYQGLENF